MKKSLLALFGLVAVLTISIASCSKDDEKDGDGGLAPGVTENPLTGKWWGDSSEDYFEVWTFNSDGTGERHTDDHTVGTYDKFTYKVTSYNKQADEYYGSTISGNVDVKYNNGTQKTYKYYREGQSWLTINGYEMKKD